jgi:hypothetical protein
MGKRKDLSLKIKKSSRFKLEDGDEGAAAVGLALGVSGGLALFVGFLMTLPELVDPEGRHDDSKTSAGLGILLAGAVATPIGWTIYGSNHTRLTRIDEGDSAAAKPLGQVRVAVVGVGSGGLGLAGVGSF